MSDINEYIKEKVCPICGKIFIVYNPRWLYKIKYKNKGQKTKYLCSYTCWRKAGGDNIRGYRHRDG